MIGIEERKKLTVSPDYIRFRGGWFKYECAGSVIIQYIYYGLGLDVLMNRFSKRWKASADKVLRENLSKEEYKDALLVKRLKKHMFKCYLLAKLKPTDYFQFKLRDKTDDEIKAYISDSSMMEILSKTGARKLHDIELNEKCNFYKIAGDWFKREAFCVESNLDFNGFAAFVKKHKRVIVKPASVGCGSGIFIYDYKDDSSVKSIFNEMMQKGSSYIVEELIVQGDDMASWNPSSVNTVRINTFKNKNGVFNHICFMRAGRSGAFVDNGGKGGIFACIDSSTGKICTNGYDERGVAFERHPDSGIKYIGWQIPKWDELLVTAKQIHATVFPKHPYIGWDFAQSNTGEWVLIEGNWGQFICQQTCFGRGCKQDVINLING